MRKLAAHGLSKTRSVKDGEPIRVLELGWGQGISGRTLLAHENVDYTVMELHPAMAANARSVFKELGKGKDEARVLLGPWEKVLPTLADRSFDVIFSDAWPTQKSGDKQKWTYAEKWEVTESNLALPRVLKPGGAHVWYTAKRPSSKAKKPWHGLANYNTWWHANMFTEFSVKKLGGLKPYDSTIYFRKGEDVVILPCGIK